MTPQAILQAPLSEGCSREDSASRRGEHAKRQRVSQSRVQSGVQSIWILDSLSQEALSAGELTDALGMAGKIGALKRTIGDMLNQGLIEYRLPDKPNSRPQKHRLTLAGARALKERSNR